MIIAKYSANKRCMFLTDSLSKNSFWKRPGMGTLRELYPEEEEVAQMLSEIQPHTQSLLRPWTQPLDLVKR